VVFWLLWLNSTINPMLYPFLQQRFRVTFVRLLTCQCRSPPHEVAMRSAGPTRTAGDTGDQRTCQMTCMTTRNDTAPAAAAAAT